MHYRFLLKFCCISSKPIKAFIALDNFIEQLQGTATAVLEWFLISSGHFPGCESLSTKVWGLFIYWWTSVNNSCLGKRRVCACVCVCCFPQTTKATSFWQCCHQRHRFCCRGQESRLSEAWVPCRWLKTALERSFLTSDMQLQVATPRCCSGVVHRPVTYFKGSLPFWRLLWHSGDWCHFETMCFALATKELSLFLFPFFLQGSDVR